MKTKIKGIKICGIASTLPNNVLNISELGSIFGEKKIKRTIISTGIERIYFTDRYTTASDLCVKAAESLIKKLMIDRKSIDAVVFVSFSPDYQAPATSAIIQSKLQLKEDIVAFDINYGCSGYIYGLYQASMLIKSGGCKRVLLCNGDTQTKFINEYDSSMKTIVGDAGAATILEEGNDILSFIIKTNGSGYKHLIIPAGGARLPFSEDTCKIETCSDGNKRCLNNLYMNGMEIMKFVLKEIPPLVKEVIEFAQWEKEKIDLYAFHQPNKLILEYLREGLNISEDIFPIAIKNVGNTGSASIPLLLSLQYSNSSNNKSLEKVIACGFGIGLSWGIATINLSDTIILEPNKY